MSVVGVSRDTVAEQKQFALDRGAFFPLLSDPDCRILRAFRVGLDKKGLPLRETFLLKDGRIVWHDPESGTRSLGRRILKAIDGYPPPAG